MRARPVPSLPSPTTTIPPTRQLRLYSSTSTLSRYDLQLHESLRQVHLAEAHCPVCLRQTRAAPGDRMARTGKDVLVLGGRLCDRKNTSFRSSHSPGAHPVNGPAMLDYRSMLPFRSISCQGNLRGLLIFRHGQGSIAGESAQDSTGLLPTLSGGFHGDREGVAPPCQGTRARGDPRKPPARHQGRFIGESRIRSLQRPYTGSKEKTRHGHRAVWHARSIRQMLRSK